MSSRSNKKLPVFVFPEELRIVRRDESTHKQVLTLYNPYDVSLKFKVLCNTLHKYTVMESQGTIKSYCCVDVVVRKLNPHQNEFVEQADKFRIDFYQGTKLIGSKHVPVKLVEQDLGPDKQINDSLDFKELPNLSKHSRETVFVSKHPREIVTPSSPGLLVILIGLVCLVCLLLPLEKESASWPDWLHVTVFMKLIASFILGLVTMAILKS